MLVKKAGNRGANQSLSGKDYFTESAFLSLGDILYEIAAYSEKHGDVRSPDNEVENIKGNTENHNPSPVVILLKATVRK